MKEITLQNGEKICALGLGTWLWGTGPAARAQEEAALREGIELGMKMVDTAEMYRNEEFVGRVVRPIRNLVFLVSKVSPENASYNGIIRACEGSLRRLGTDRLDMYLLHWKGRYPLEETVSAMTALQQSGKIRMWGVSNLDIDDMKHIRTLSGGTACAADQVKYNLGVRDIEYDLLPWAQENGIPIIAYQPIGRKTFLDDATLGAIARKHGASPAQIALAWSIHRHGVMSIPKSSSVEHVRQNYGALSITLSPEDLSLLDAAFPAPGSKIPMQQYKGL